jgi:hypothetical protein
MPIERVKYNKHHILFDRVDWTARKEAFILRNCHSLIPIIDKSAHEELHANCPSVPMLGFHALQHINDEFQPVENTTKAISNLLKAIETINQEPRFHEIEKQLANLAIMAVELQLEYL